MTEHIGIFGGSFNPPHTAHVVLVREALRHPHGPDKVLIIPTYVHAFGKSLAPYEMRMQMLRLAFAPPLFPEDLLKRVEFSEIERELGGVSYTVETVRELQRRMPNVRFHLLIGGDLVEECRHWRESDELLRTAPPMALPRSGTPHKEFPEGKGQWLEGVELPPASSTDVRKLLADETSLAQKQLAQLLPLPVLDFVRRHNLYS